MAIVQSYRWHIWTFGADTGTFSQIALSAFSGFQGGPEAASHFRYHWSPIIATLFPLVAVTHSALSLQFVQFMLVALCAFPLYAIARAYASERTALYCGLLPLIYPPLVAVAFGEFHELAFYPLIALALFWTADRERWAAFAALALVSALVKEDCCIVFVAVGLALTAMGIARRDTQRGGLLLFEPKTPRALAIAGIGLAAVNALALVVYFIVVVPRVGGLWQPAHFFDYPFGYGPAAITVALLLHPWLLGRVITYAKIGYLLEAFAPLAFLPLRSWWTLLALPGLAELVLSSEWGAFRMGSHYAAIWIPWLVLAAAAVLVGFERAGGLRRATRAFAATAAICALFFIAFDPVHPLHFMRQIYPHDAVRPLAALVPRDASLITHDEWFAQLAIDFPKATIFPYTAHEYALFADDYPNAYYQTVSRAQLLADLASGRAKQIRRIGHVALYRLEPPRGVTQP